MKYFDQPEKFMESEIELYEEINNLFVVSASPELYPTLIESGSVVSILGMIAHENTDISLASIGLINELTDPETVLETEEAIQLVDALIDGQVYQSLLTTTSTYIY
jgi:beta-catenin-like protein 1